MSNVPSVSRPRTPEQRQAAIDRAIARAHEQAQAGNLPRLLRQFHDPEQTRQVWAISSRTTGGVVYTVDLIADADGLHTHCHECQAATAGRLCWHRAACRLAVLGELPQAATPPAPAARPITREDIFGRQAAC